MDEGTLNDLLECSVCLDRLDTSSKVLPCQHTFCRKCLQEIFHKHKELKCPECRVLVTTKIDDLPPNVLLMRILDSMKNSGKAASSETSQKSKTPLLQPDLVQHSTPAQQHLERDNNEQSAEHVIPNQPYAKALYDYISNEPGDLSFTKDDIIILKKKMDTNTGWCQGEFSGKEGIFPSNFVQIITPVPSHIPQCKALYDFRMTNYEEEGCLSFNKGDLINVIRCVNENWAEGKLDGRIGIFPLAFVEMNSSAMKLFTDVKSGLSKVARPSLTAKDSKPLSPTDHSTSISSIASYVPQQVPVSASDSSLNNITSSSTSSSSSLALFLPTSPPTRTDRSAVSLRNSSDNLEVKNLMSIHQQQPSLQYLSHTCDVEGRSSSHHHHHCNEENKYSLTNEIVPHHPRSGFCPSRLLQFHSQVEDHQPFSLSSHYMKHSTPCILSHSSRLADTSQGGCCRSSPYNFRYCKSHSFDATNQKPSKITTSQTIGERFRDIAPYPPMSECELDLRISPYDYDRSDFDLFGTDPLRIRAPIGPGIGGVGKLFLPPLTLLERASNLGAPPNLLPPLARFDPFRPPQSFPNTGVLQKPDNDELLPEGNDMFI